LDSSMFNRDVRHKQKSQGQMDWDIQFWESEVAILVGV
jgi:hypothetical protein